MRRLGPRPATVRSYLQAFKQILDYEAVPPDRAIRTPTLELPLSASVIRPPGIGSVTASLQA